MASAIEVAGLGKRYRLGTDSAGYDTLRDVLRRTATRRRTQREEHWALRDLDLTVDQGEALGIIGRNGAGKTTLLRILAGITEPTRGEARTRGRVGALLDVGTGFHPELTGRENVFLSGAILGLRRAAVREKLDEIVAFAGMEPFLDTPVKRYSSGMRLRLAFAVAAHIEPPILVVDEVLAVGDAEFREKCLGRMAEIGRHARTVLFVSHDLGAITRLCSRAVWLDAGRLNLDGRAEEVVSAYLTANLGAPLLAEFDADEREAVSITGVALRDEEGRLLTAAQRDQSLTVDLRWVARERIPGLDIAVRLLDESGVPVIDDARADHAEGLPGHPGTYRATVTLPGLLAPGRYVLGAWIGTEQLTHADRDMLTVEVLPRPDDRQLAIDRRRAVIPEARWAVEHEPLA